MLSDQTRSKHIRGQGKKKGSFIYEIFGRYFMLIYTFFYYYNEDIINERQQKIQRDKEVHEAKEGWRSKTKKKLEDVDINQK